MSEGGIYLDNKYVCYMHISPSNKKYIGITCQETDRRWQKGKGYKNNQYFSIVHQQSSLTQSLEPISFKPNAYHHAKEITISCNRMQPVYIIITMTNL